MLAAAPFVIQGLATLAPAVLGLLKKDSTASQAIEVLSATARAITGESTEAKALEVLKNDPAKLVEFQISMNTLAVKIFEGETERLQMVNDTMRAEATSKYRFVRCMRPLFGYAIVGCIVLMFATVTGIFIFAGIDKGVKAITAYAKMEWVIIAALAVIGVYVKKRSDEKMGVVGSIGKMLGR